MTDTESCAQMHKNDSYPNNSKDTDTNPWINYIKNRHYIDGRFAGQSIKSLLGSSLVSADELRTLLDIDNSFLKNEVLEALEAINRES